MEKKVSIVVAYGSGQEIGGGNDLLWNLPADMKHFRELTMGNSLVMGRKTWQSIGKPLPGREMIVVTRGEDIKVPDVVTAHSLDEALGKASRSLVNIIGGGEIYRQSLDMPEVNTVYATELAASFSAADTYFPYLERSDGWFVTSWEHHRASEASPYHHTFVTYERHLQAKENPQT